MFTKTKRGFTLIELLVVIAIIGILSSVVLVSLNSARNKGSDAAVKSQLAQVRSQAALIYDNRQCFNDDANGTCTTAFAAGACANTAGTLFGNAQIWSQVSAAATNGTASRCIEDATDQNWAVVVQLKSGGTAADTTPDTWCVDSTGASKAYTWAAAETIASSLTGNACK